MLLKRYNYNPNLKGLMRLLKQGTKTIKNKADTSNKF
jgi:hypothetical protein